MKAFEESNSNVGQMIQFLIETEVNIVGKRRKCWLPAFSPFTTMFLQGVFLRIINTWYCLVKG